MNQTRNLMTAFIISAFAMTAHAAGKYAIDPAHSKVGFEIPHLVISSVEGRFSKYDGQIELADKFTDSKVTATIDVSSIDTANADRDKHLKSADFFDAQKYPNITFKSKKITGTADNFKVVGDLTIHGKTKEATLEGKYLGVAKDAYGNEKAAFNASTKINRQDYGLKWSKAVEVGPVVGDDVTITLKVQGTKTK